VLLDFLIVGIDREILGAQGTIDAGTCDELHRYLGREGTQHLTLRHVQPSDGDALDTLFSEQVGDEGDLHMIGHHLDALDLGNLALGDERVAEVGIVEGLGVEYTDAVELLVGGVDGDTVGHVFHA